MTDREYIDSLLEQNGKLVEDNKKLRRANSSLKGENRKLRRFIDRKLKEKEKQHYRNGQKRGRTRNG